MPNTSARMADRTAIVPDGLDFATATVVSRHAPTAFTLLRDRAKLQAGEWVLVMGAAGGLGSAGIQVAKYLGAKVIAAAGADERVKVGLDLGADAGVNYRAQDLTIEAMRITEGKGVNVVFENIGDPDLFPKAFAALARRGRLVTAGGHGGGIVPLDVNRLYQNHLTIIGATGETPEDVTVSSEGRGRGQASRSLIDRIMPLSQARAGARADREPQRHRQDHPRPDAIVGARPPARRRPITSHAQIGNRGGGGTASLRPSNGAPPQSCDSYFCVIGFISNAELTLL